MHKHCAFRHAAVSIVKDVETLIWEVERRPPMYKKNLEDTVIEIQRRNCGTKFASQWNWSEFLALQKPENGMLICLLMLLRTMLMMLICWAEAYVLLRKAQKL